MKKYAVVNFYDFEGRLDTRQYHYKTLFNDLESGDEVVVETVKGNKVARFSHYLLESDHARSYIIQKIDVDFIEKEKEKQIRLEEIKQSIETRVAEITERKKYEKLAKDDKKLQELLSQMDEVVEGKDTDGD